MKRRGEVLKFTAISTLTLAKSSKFGVKGEGGSKIVFFQFFCDFIVHKTLRISRNFLFKVQFDFFLANLGNKNCRKTLQLILHLRNFLSSTRFWPLTSLDAVFNAHYALPTNFNLSRTTRQNSFPRHFSHKYAAPICNSSEELIRNIFVEGLIIIFSYFYPPEKEEGRRNKRKKMKLNKIRYKKRREAK